MTKYLNDLSNEMKHILFISYDGMTDPLGQSQVIPYLIGLTKKGYRFTILSCEKNERYALYKNEIEKLLNPFPIEWVAIPYHRNPPVVSSAFDTFMLVRKAKKLHSKNKFDMVHTRPGTPALAGLWIKKKLGVKFLNDIRDFFAESRIDSGAWNKNNFIYKSVYRFFKQKENEAVEKSDGIICLTYKAKKIITSWPQYKTNIPLDVIPCSVEMNLFDPEKINLQEKLKFKTELNISDDDFIFSYLGSIGSWYLTDELLSFFKVVSKKISHAKFLFISPDKHEIILNAAKRNGLDQNKIIIKKAKRTEVPVLLSFSKFSAFFIKPCYSKQASSPTKHGEIMAMGIPVITNSGVGDVADIVERSKSGIVIKNFNEEEYEAVANRIAEGISFDKTLIKNAALEYYNLENAVEKYDKIYETILE
jgi:glycosyltransferase involved in cell wall biosynthesis